MVCEIISYRDSILIYQLIFSKIKSAAYRLHYWINERSQTARFNLFINESSFARQSTLNELLPIEFTRLTPKSYSGEWEITNREKTTPVISDSHYTNPNYTNYKFQRTYVVPVRAGRESTQLALLSGDWEARNTGTKAASGRSKDG